MIQCLQVQYGSGVGCLMREEKVWGELVSRYWGSKNKTFTSKTICEV